MEVSCSLGGDRVSFQSPSLGSRYKQAFTPINQSMILSVVNSSSSALLQLSQSSSLISSLSALLPHAGCSFSGHRAATRAVPLGASPSPWLLRRTLRPFSGSSGRFSLPGPGQGSECLRPPGVRLGNRLGEIGGSWAQLAWGKPRFSGAATLLLRRPGAGPGAGLCTQTSGPGRLQPFVSRLPHANFLGRLHGAMARDK
eukprot:g39093.t1